MGRNFNNNRNSNFRSRNNRGKKKFGRNHERSDGNKSGRKKDYGNRERRDENKFERKKDYGNRERRDENKFGRKKDYGNRERRDENKFGRKKDYGNRERRDENKFGRKKDYGNRERRDENKFGRKKDYGNRERRDENKFGRKKDYDKRENRNFKKAFTKSDKPFSKQNDPAIPSETGFTRLNKYLANAGICSRREADKFIEAGAVKVNGKIITQLGYKVAPGDKVQFGNDTVHKEKTVYILLNKPKGYITTTDDERDRSTVLDLVQGVEERIYPVGRLDRNTSGLLLLTNDGELAKTLMHPKYNVPKVYHIVLDSSLRPDDIDKIRNGIELEDGF